MLLSTEHEFGQLPIIKIKGDLSQGRAVHAICHEIETLRKCGQIRIVLDLTNATSIGFCSAFAVVEIATREALSDIAFYGAKQELISALSSSGMKRFLNVHDTKDAAIASIQLPSEALSGIQAVVLCAGSGTRMGPLSQRVPKPLLDVFGTPVLGHLTAHLSKFGIRDICLNPGHLGPQIPEYFKNSPQPGVSVRYFPEGDWHGNDWHAQAIGSASTLARLKHRYHAISGDVIVMCGDALTDIDLPAMMAHHKATNSMVTIAAKPVPHERVSRYGIIVANANDQVTSFQEKPDIQDAKSNLANVGIYIVNAAALETLPHENDQDIAHHLLPKLMRSGVKISVYTGVFNWMDMGCGKDYFEVLSTLLETPLPLAQPLGRLLRPGLWVHPTAKVADKAQISGRCYVGAGAKIAGSARIEGHCTIGKNSIVGPHCRLRNSIVLADTCVQEGTVLQDMITSDAWALPHRKATHKDAEYTWLRGRSATDETPNQPLLEKAS